MEKKKGLMAGLFGGKKSGGGCCNMEIVEEPAPSGGCCDTQIAEGTSCICGGTAKESETTPEPCCCKGNE